MTDLMQGNKSMTPRIVFKETRQAGSSIKKLMDASTARSEMIIARAKEEADSIRKEAYRDGLESGKGDAVSYILEANRYRDDLEASARSEMLELCVSVVKKIAFDLAENHEEWILCRIEQGLKLLKEDRAIRIRLNPVDFETHLMKLQACTSKDSPDADIRFTADATLSRGDCIFESGSLEIDGRVSAFLSRIEAHFTGLLPVNKKKGVFDERKFE